MVNLTNWCITWLTWPSWSTYLSDASALVVNWPKMMHQSNSYRWVFGDEGGVRSLGSTEVQERWHSFLCHLSSRVQWRRLRSSMAQHLSRWTRSRFTFDCTGNAMANTSCLCDSRSMVPGVTVPPLMGVYRRYTLPYSYSHLTAVSLSVRATITQFSHLIPMTGICCLATPTALSFKVTGLWSRANRAWCSTKGRISHPLATSINGGHFSPSTPTSATSAERLSRCMQMKNRCRLQSDLRPCRSGVGWNWRVWLLWTQSNRVQQAGGCAVWAGLWPGPLTP